VLQLALSALVFSTLAAIAKRAVAAALRLRATIVVGLGPKLGGDVPRRVELRPFPLWIWTRLDEAAPTGRAAAAAIIGPLCVLIVPFAIGIAAMMATGVEEQDRGPPMVAGAIVDGSPAEAAGIEVGDHLVAVEGAAIADFDALVGALDGREGTPTRIEVERGGRTLEIVVVPRGSGGRAVIGVAPPTVERDIGFGEAASRGFRVIGAIWASVMSLFEPADTDLAGPVGMVRAARGSTPRTGMVVALLALSWSAISPIWALVISIGEVVMLVRMRRAAA
jgi:membrane-associated protease RseP (regulator of RpoE activity)